MKMLKTSLLARLLRLPMLCVTAQAQTAATPVTCKDGTTSTTTGKGACSHHGGVDKSAAAASGGAPRNSTPAPPTPPAPAPSTPAAPAAAGSVMCKDGTTSTTT